MKDISTAKKICVRVSVSVFAFLFVCGNTPLALADRMTSTNYTIQADSVNVGGARSASTNFRLEDTAGEIATGDSSSTNFKLRAGYQQMAEVSISLSAAADVTMSPTIGGVSGGTSNGQTSVTVITDSPAGYQLTIKASSSPAMQGNTHGETIANYTPAGAAPDFTFSVPSTAAEFGFTPEGSDTATQFLDNGSACNTGSGETANACWAALTTAAQTISSRTTANSPSGTATTIKFRITLGSASLTVADTYVATSTVTATAS